MKLRRPAYIPILYFLGGAWEVVGLFTVYVSDLTNTWNPGASPIGFFESWTGIGLLFIAGIEILTMLPDD